jgi:F-type H+-transporting ATPase subunit epsilon
MKLEILLPFKIFASVEDVTHIVAETAAGSFGLLPHRLDCVAAIVPGILSFTTEHGTTYVAVDEGALVKCGDKVVISVRRATGGTALHELHEAVVRQYLDLDAQEREMRSLVAKMDGGLIGRMAELRHGQ